MRTALLTFATSGSISSNTGGATMSIQKLSISLPQQQYDFIEHYQYEHHYKTRSEVIKIALALLQESALRAAYQQASQELDDSFDTTTSDGLEDDETW